MLKALFVLQVFTCCRDVFQANGLIGKLSLVSKFMTLQTGQHVNEISSVNEI